MKKIVAVFLSLTMVFTMSSTVFADSSASVRSGYSPAYFSLGDSIGAGFGIDWLNEDETCFDFENMTVRWDALTPSGRKNDETNFLKGAYPEIFMGKIKGSRFRSYDASYPALRSREACEILGLLKCGEYGSQFYDSFLNKTGFGLTDEIRFLEKDCIDTMKKYKGALKKYISTADVISVQLGVNDITEFVVTSLLDPEKSKVLVNDILALVKPEDVPCVKAEFGKLTAAVKGYVENPDPQNLMCAVYGFNAELVKYGIEFEKVMKIMFDDTRDTLKNSMRNSVIYFNTLMNYINKNKRYDAVVLVVNVYNPLNMQNMNVCEEGAVTCGGQDVIDVLEQTVEPMVNVINRNISKNSDRFDYTVVDVKGNNVQSHPLLLFHPDRNGQMKIARLMKHAYDKAYNELQERLWEAAWKDYDKQEQTSGEEQEPSQEPTVCEHLNTELAGEVPATYLECGYTGDVVCKDCRELIEHGNEIAKLVPDMTDITKLKKGVKSFTVKWGKRSDMSGYQIRYSTDSTFKHAKKAAVNSSSTVKKTVKKLKSGKKYYVSVRTYKTVKTAEGKDVKCYSAWSAKKAVKVK